MVTYLLSLNLSATVLRDLINIEIGNLSAYLWEASFDPNSCLATIEQVRCDLALLESL